MKKIADSMTEAKNIKVVLTTVLFSNVQSFDSLNVIASIISFGALSNGFGATSFLLTPIIERLRYCRSLQQVNLLCTFPMDTYV